MRRAALSVSLPALLEQVGEDAGGQQPLVFGEHAEQALDEEVGDLLAVLAAHAHGGGEFGEVAGGLRR